ncbi:crispr-associated protein [hydrocarbon metagenome]|uniref:Crispr-associated protein n=1 Tax=hydrocarbon metagenome TaxID=938273 RepID=A0A0W8G1Q3_9ZZZZ
MKYENKVEFKVFGKYALFTDPLTKIGGEKCTYQIPTYEALKGIICSVYWKPTIIWFIDKVRIMKPIKTQTKSTKPIVYGGGNSLSIYTYLSEVEYQVQAHFEWNKKREDLVNDQNEHKHWYVARRMIERGGRRDIFLGARECQGYVEPCSFGEGKGHYDEIPELAFGLMFHGFDYPDEGEDRKLKVRFWHARMNKGVVEFPQPSECSISKFVRSMHAQEIQTIGLDEEGILEGYNEEEASK